MLQIVHSTVATLPDQPGVEINKAEWNDDHIVTGTLDQDMNNVAVDGVTILGDGTPGNPLTAVGGGTGTVETISIATANGFSGSSDGDPTNPELTITTTIGAGEIPVGNGTGGFTDAPVTGAGNIVLSNGASFLNATITSSSVNGVTLVSGGSSTLYLSEDGTYSTPAGGGSPAGSNTQVQYNNSGSFGASNKFTFVASTSTLTISDGLGISSTVITDFQITVDTITVGSISASSQIDGDILYSISGANLNGEVYLNYGGSPVTDHTAQGPQTAGFDAGASITVIQLCYLNSSSEWVLADADAASTSAGMLAISLQTQTSGNPMNVALPGSIVRDDTWAWTPGAILYVDTTAGAITATAPSATGDIVRVVGYAMTADSIFFNPSGAWVEVA